MKIFIAPSFLFFLTCSCTAEIPNSERKNEETPEELENREQKNFPNLDARSEENKNSLVGSCGNGKKKETFHLDGGTVVFLVPIPCDPLWKLKDRGDPAP